MSRILIEATPFEIFDRDTDFRHLYLVFEDDQGVETVITAAPDEDGPFDFGNIEVNAGGLLEDSDVARGNGTPGERGSRVILESEGDAADGRDPADVWTIMLQQAQNIDGASLDYRPLGDNSNTVIKSVLHAVGIDIRDNLPNAVDQDEAVGLSNDLDFSTTLVGTAGDDVIVGGDEADVLRGGAGEDRMEGGRGADRLAGGTGDDQLIGGPGADRMRGGPGSDSFDADAGDTILDFDAAEGDSLLLADLLDGFDPATSEVDEFVSLSEQAGDTLVGVNADGQGADALALVTLAGGVNGATLDTLIANDNVVVTPPTS
jgi:Ca2+-binding RTX toxin-like protein